MTDSSDADARALVLFSGGQDSATCLAWALERFSIVETVGFSYGQRHAVELRARESLLKAFREDFPKWRGKLGQDRTLNLDVLADIGGEALTSEAEIAMGENGLPNTFVPGRNLLFLTTAAALAYRRGASVLVGGMCETDFSGYPDCRRDSIEAQGEAIRLGMEFALRLETPLMHLSKAETWGLAHTLGGEALVELILEESHTCYRGVRDLRHPWGYGCGNCPACKLRAVGFALWKAS